MAFFITQLSIFIFSLLVLFISVSLLPFKPSLHHPIKDQPRLNLASQNPQSEKVTHQNYIVRFVEYKRSEDHKGYLIENVNLKNWEWVERRNPASKFPTDFGLISIGDDDPVRRKELIEQFWRLKLVKDVSADLSYQRSLLGKGRSRERMGAFVDGRKRPGKIFTSMSFSEAESFVAAATSINSTISWKRNLLIEV